MRIVKTAVSILLIAFLALSPKWLIRGLDADFCRTVFERPKPAWQGRLELWHIASFRTRQGSVTDYLQQRADAFCRQNPGVYIDVKGLTEKKYNDRLARGAAPDLYSFAAGLCYPEQLSPVSLPLPTMAGNLSPVADGGTVLAVPYLMSGYVLCANMQLTAGLETPLPEAPDAAFLQSVLDGDNDENPSLYIPAVHAARLKLTGVIAADTAFRQGKAAYAVLDAYAYNALVNDDKVNIIAEAVPFPPYTDEVFCLGIAKGADDNRRAAAERFMAFLLSPKEQARLSTLGALPVAEADEAVFADELAESMQDAYRSPVTPKPFAYQRHRDALTQEAADAVAGDALASASFFERMAVVENGIL